MVKIIFLHPADGALPGSHVPISVVSEALRRLCFSEGPLILSAGTLFSPDGELDAGNIAELSHGQRFWRWGPLSFREKLPHIVADFSA